MVESWVKDGKAFSNINNDDSSFFKQIWTSPDSVGTTSQTGNDLIYYNIDIYSNDKDAINGIRSMGDGGEVKKDNSIGFIPMDLEENLRYIARFNDVSIKDVIGFLSAMIDSGLTDADLKTPPTKTGRQYEKAREKKVKEIWSIIEPNYKGELKGNMYYSIINRMLENNDRLGVNYLERFKPYRKYQKDSMAEGGAIKNTIRFTENDYKRLVEDRQNDYPFYSIEAGNYWAIKKEKNNNSVAKFYPLKQELVVWGNDSDLIEWLRDHSYKLSEGGAIEQIDKEIIESQFGKTE